MFSASSLDLDRRVLSTIKARAIINLPRLTDELDLGRGGATLVRETLGRLIAEGKVERVHLPRAGYRIRKTKTP
jgi:DNA-binding GntR family transcriptional regulator